jgi:hypothetical protein
MKQLDLIRWAMAFTAEATEQIIADMRDAPMTRPMPGGKAGGGNHPMWLMGHLAFIEGAVRQELTGEKNPLEGWAPLFAPGTRPTDDAGAYPPFDEVVATYQDLRGKNLELLEELGEAGLDRKPSAALQGFKNQVTTCGQFLLLIAMHNMVHYGQIADARRAAGRKPLR